MGWKFEDLEKERLDWALLRAAKFPDPARSYIQRFLLAVWSGGVWQAQLPGKGSLSEWRVTGWEFLYPGQSQAR